MGIFAGPFHYDWMKNRIPDQERIEGVHYAMTKHGVELPIIDITHPSFKIDESDAAMRALGERVTADMERWSKRPQWLRRLMFAMASRRSTLLRGVRASKGTYLTALHTYLGKLPPAHLASNFATPVDRRVANSPLFVGLRLRLQIMAELLGEYLLSEISRAPGDAPVCFLNIAGGPAMDSLNALLWAQREAGSVLAGRAIEINVLDKEDEAPLFGQNALGMMTADDGPLSGLRAHLRHEPYDWNNPGKLREILLRQPADALSLGSSEGGLFHYSSDEIIRANLEALHEGTSRQFAFAGTYSPETPLHRVVMSFTQASSRFLEPAAFEKLVTETGWKVDRQVAFQTVRCVRLVKR